MSEKLYFIPESLVKEVEDKLYHYPNIEIEKILKKSLKQKTLNRMLNWEDTLTLRKFAKEEPLIQEDPLNNMTKEQTLEELKKMIHARDSMGGNLYWNIVNARCIYLADLCLVRGVEFLELRELMGEGNYR